MPLISGGLVLDDPHAPPRRVDILVEGDTIVDLLPPGTQVAAEVVRADRRLVIPGLVNSHTHSNGGLSRGLGDRWSLELLLNALPWLGGQRTVRHKHLAALVNAIDMVERGTTACYDLFYEFPVPSREGIAAVASAYERVGLRAVIAPMVADRSFYEGVPGLADALPGDAGRRAAAMRATEAGRTVAALRALAQDWPYPTDRIRMGVAPTIPLLCSAELLRGCAEVAREHGLVMQSHLSESRALSFASLRGAGRTMTETMAAEGLLGPWFSAAHAVWTTERDVELLARAGAQVSHNPGSNLRLGAGIANVREYLRQGVAVGLGTDGGPSSGHQNLFEAARLATYVSRADGSAPEQWLSSPEALEMATRGSARVLGMQDLVGRIAPGYKADLVLLDLDHINYIPLHDAAGQVVNSENGAAVDRVFVGGRLVVERGRAVGIDHAALAAEVQAAVEDLATLNAGARQLAEQLAPVVSGFCRGGAAPAALADLPGVPGRWRCQACGGAFGSLLAAR